MNRAFGAAGYAAMIGGAVGLVLAPVMVTIKYMTGWDVVPEPMWVGTARRAGSEALRFATPAGLWTTFGTMYSLALVLMLAGFIGLIRCVKNVHGRLHSKGYVVALVGLCLVIPGDAIHTWTWHQHGLTTPTPGTNPVANTAYAVHMMGMNLLMLGTMMIGVSGFRRKALAPSLALIFVLVFPAAVAASVTVLPTTPSGALWLFSWMMIASGFQLAVGRPDRLARRLSYT